MKDSNATPTKVQESNPSSVFISMALDMSWRLAVVVVVPIVGGHTLDQHWHSSPWLSIAGFVVAGFGVAGVLRRMLREAGKLPVPKSEISEKSR